MRSITDLIRIDNCLIKELIAEFVGTLFLVHIGTCVSAQNHLSRHAESSPMVVTFGWGLAVMFAVTISFNVSGGLVNPSLALMNWWFGKLPLLHVLAYSVVETLGALCGAALTFAAYHAAIDNYDFGIRTILGDNSTSQVFLPFPAEFIGITSGLIDAIISTIIFCLGVAAVVDERNKVPSFLIPLFIGLNVMLVSAGYGMNAGYPVNPARDLGPRIFMLCAGYGSGTFSHNNWKWFWIPIVGPLIGAVIAAWFYKVYIALVKSNKIQSVDLEPQKF